MTGKNLIVATADKDNAVVVLLTTKYLELAHEHLSDNTNFYVKTQCRKSIDNLLNTSTLVKNVE